MVVERDNVRKVSCDEEGGSCGGRAGLRKEGDEMAWGAWGNEKGTPHHSFLDCGWPQLYRAGRPREASAPAAAAVVFTGGFSGCA